MGIYIKNNFMPTTKIKKEIIPSGQFSISAIAEYNIYNYSTINVNIEDNFQKFLRNIKVFSSTIYENSKTTKIAPYARVILSGVSIINTPNVETIGISAFAACPIGSISFPKCIKIDDYAFYQCAKLNSINLPNCEYIGKYAFCSCFSTSSIFIDLPNCKHIDEMAFGNCYSLTSINLPNCEYIGVSAFLSCRSLTTIDLPKCSYIGESAFSSCTLLTSVNIPACKTLTSRAFYGCKNLNFINLEQCEYIGSFCFINFSLLTSINLPNCSYIGSYAFSGCSALNTVYLSDCSVSYQAFFNCYNLMSIYLYGSSIVSNLSTTLANTPMSKSSYTGQYGSIYVKASLVNTYKAQWTSYANRITAIPE